MAAVVSGIFIIWTNFTKEAFKLSWRIISHEEEKETYKAVTKVMCKECKMLFFADDNICFTCRGGFSIVD